MISNSLADRSRNPLQTSRPRSTTRPRILAITPARNEADLLPATIDSMIQQRVRPDEWVIVDDGSTDSTFLIAQCAADKHDWIHVIRRGDRGQRVLGRGVIEAFREGFESSELDWDYVCKVDADIRFGEEYLATIVEHFEADPTIGSMSGKFWFESDSGLVEERICDDSVAGCFKVYSRECYSAIGGLQPAVMWDGIDFHRARQENFRTLSSHDERLRIVHRRRMGSSDRGILRGRFRHGTGQYYLGSHPLYMLASAASRLGEWPFVFGSLAMLTGYAYAALTRRPRFEHPGFREELHAWQLGRLRNAMRSGSSR